MTKTAGDVSDFGNYEWKIFAEGLKKFFILSTFSLPSHMAYKPTKWT